MSEQPGQGRTSRAAEPQLAAARRARVAAARQLTMSERLSRLHRICLEVGRIRQVPRERR
jgi:hypothetical protein